MQELRLKYSGIKILRTEEKIHLKNSFYYAPSQRYYPQGGREKRTIMNQSSDSNQSRRVRAEGWNIPT